MKNIKNGKARLFLSIFVLSMASCTPQEVTPASISTFSGDTGGKIDSPVLRLNDARTGLTWDEVPGASSYEIYVNEEEPVEGTSHQFIDAVGEYTVKVKAVASNHEMDSEFSNPFTYSSDLTKLGNLSFQENKITWGEASGELKAKIDEGEYFAVEGNFLQVDRSGIYTFKVEEGFNEDTSTFFFGGTIEKHIVVSPYADATVILEDASAPSDTDLKENYSIEKNHNNEWVKSTASITLDDTNEGISEGKCAKLQFWHHGEWFKYEKEVSFENYFDTFSFFIKGDGTNRISLSFQINEHVIVGGIDLAGVYIIYQIEHVPEGWSKYDISLNDSNWRVDYNQQRMEVRTVLAMLDSAGYTIPSLGHMLPYFNVFQMRCMAPSDSTGSKSYIWIDDIKLHNTGNPTSIVVMAAIKDNYAISTETGVGGYLNKNGNDWTMVLIQEGENTIIPVTVSKESDNQARIISSENGMDFDLIAHSEDGGNTFVLDSVSGSLSSKFTGFRMGAYTPVDSFDYESTGVGYDKNHAETEVSGLRAAYYCDYYSGNGTSPMGGNGWELMGSSDYLDLVKTDGNSVDGCAKIKHNKDMDMRFTSWGLYKGSGKAMGSGKYFSFFAKGSTAKDISLKIRIFYAPQVNSTNQGQGGPSLLTEGIVIAKDSDWCEYTIELNPNTVYYGFSIIPVKDYLVSNAFFFIDDITIYNDISPWGN